MRGQLRNTKHKQWYVTWKRTVSWKERGSGTGYFSRMRRAAACLHNGPSTLPLTLAPLPPASHSELLTADSGGYTPCSREPVLFCTLGPLPLLRLPLHLFQCSHNAPVCYLDSCAALSFAALQIRSVRLLSVVITPPRLLCWLSYKEPTWQCRRLGLDPWIGKILWRRK